MRSKDVSDVRLPLEDYLRREGVWFRIFEKPSTTHTFEASKVTGIPLERITKSLVFKADGHPILAVVAGDKKVDTVKLAEAVGADKIELVPFNEADDYSGYPPGGTPPVYHTNIEKVVFDRHLTSFETIYGGGGSRSKLLELRVQDALKLSQGIATDISKC